MDFDFGNLMVLVYIYIIFRGLASSRKAKKQRRTGKTTGKAKPVFSAGKKKSSRKKKKTFVPGPVTVWEIPVPEVEEKSVSGETYIIPPEPEAVKPPVADIRKRVRKEKPAPAPVVQKRKSSFPVFSGNPAVNAVIWSEVLSKPVSRRK